MGSVPVSRSEVRLEPDPGRRIVKPFLPGGDNPLDGRSRIAHVLDRALAITPEDAARTLDAVQARFAARHDDPDELLTAGYATVAHLIDGPATLSADRQRLVGAYFIHEYTIEAAALTNPSIVVAPDQSGVPAGSVRFVLSLRAIGEGHLSSVEFRTGLIGRDARITVDPAPRPRSGERRAPVLDKELFGLKLGEIAARDADVDHVLDQLGDTFTMEELETVLAAEARRDPSAHVAHAVSTIHWLASSNYELTFPPESAISQRVLFPAGPAESRGMEDARFVRFQDGDGQSTYYATYTAYDGFNILPQLIETADFRNFRMTTLNGAAARNKGIAVFPRQVDGRFAALGRSDNESNHLMFSDNIHFWHDTQRIQAPARPWELFQIGNCGSPIETEAGWLVITHGVGPLRTYALGAILLDRDDPRRVVGHLRDPLLEPDESERDGYVPNVVYSCGALVHDGTLVLAYGAADTSTRFATVPLDALLGELT